MKSFFSSFLGSCLGFMAGIFLLFMMLGALLQGIARFSDREPDVKDNSVLELNLNMNITERITHNPFSNFDILSLSSVPSMGLDQILAAISKASDDSRIKGIWLHTEQVSAGLATLNAIRSALVDFKAKGKFIISYADSYDQKAYYLASVSNYIFLPPTGSLSWKGLSVNTLYYKKLLDRFAIDLQPIRHGKFKSAVEPFLVEEMSAENREQLSTLLRTVWSHMTDSVASSRGLDRGQLDGWAQEQLFRDERKALEMGMIDSILYFDQAEKVLSSFSGGGDSYNAIALMDYARMQAPSLPLIPGQSAVAVVYAFGDLVSGSSTAGQMGAETIRDALREAVDDIDVKAIVLRINSPGGSALAAEMVWREVKQAANSKPLVVSMGDMAASGGYYMALPAKEIWADPVTLTGSIGVYGLYPCFETLLEEKIGITPQEVATHSGADAGSFFRKMTPLEAEWAQESVERVYQTFLNHVVEQRPLSAAAADSVAQGRVWSGADAMRIGLIDSLGNLHQAIARAAVLANLYPYSVKGFPKEKSFVEELLGDVGFALKARFSTPSPFDELPVPTLKRLLRERGIQMRMPEGFELTESLWLKE